MHRHHPKNALAKKIRRVGAQFAGAALLSAALAPSAAAQDVTLRFASGQDSMSGALTDFKDGRFFLDSPIGLVVIPTDGVICIGDACPDGTRLQLENARVVLTAKDGTASITGDLIEVDGNDYVVATSIGEQRVGTSLVFCEGEGCVELPELTDAERVVELTNGGITLKGLLIGFENNSFILDDEIMGEIRVSAAEFACSGVGCP
jgi:small nuclear ribonucleoprotein (snRNP)-like protein